MSRARRWLSAGLLAGVFLSAGCVSTKSMVSKEDKPPTGPVCQLVATWSKEVAYAPDPTHNGNPTPGLTCRLFLFGDEISYPIEGDGGLVVDLYDDTAAGPGKPPALIEEWRIDKDTLKKFLRRDIVGWGYTLFLPWGTYRPDIAQVHLKVRYDPGKGTPLFTDSSSMALERKTDGNGPIVATRTIRPKG